MFDEQLEISVRIADVLRQLVTSSSSNGGGGGAVCAAVARRMKQNIPRFLRIIDNRTSDHETYGDPNC